MDNLQNYINSYLVSGEIPEEMHYKLRSIFNDIFNIIDYNYQEEKKQMINDHHIQLSNLLDVIEQLKHNLMMQDAQYRIYKDLKENPTEMQQTINKLQDERLSLQLKFKEVEDSNQTFLIANEKLFENTSNLRSKNKELEDKLLNTSLQCHSYEKSVYDLQQDNDVLKKEFNKSIREIQTLNTTLTELKQRHNQYNKKLQKEVNTLQKNNKRLQLRLKNSEQMCENYEEHSTELYDKLSKIRQQDRRDSRYIMFLVFYFGFTLFIISIYICNYIFTHRNYFNLRNYFQL